jgi:hypothetical protein
MFEGPMRGPAQVVRWPADVSHAIAELSPLCPTLQRYCRHRANAVQAISTQANGLTHVSEQSDYSIT